MEFVKLKSLNRKARGWFILLLGIFASLSLLFFQCSRTEIAPVVENNSGSKELNSFQKQIIQSDNKFGFKVFNKIIQADINKNIFISPASISYAFTMAYNAANGITQQQIQNVLELQGLTKDEINSNYKKIVDLLQSIDPKIQIQIANSIWYRLGYTLENTFINDCKNYFNAEVNGLDFSSAEAAGIINGWVEKNTYGKIKEIIKKQIDPDVIVYLINAIYFKGSWLYRFEEKNTKEDNFYLTGGNSIKCMMMNQSARYLYYENDDFQAVDLPYGNGSFSMSILLPKYGINTDNVISKLDQDYWSQLLTNFKKDSVVLSLPKFKMDYEIKLNDILISMGMSEAFLPSADFTGMMKPKTLFISEAKHKTFVEVNEEGTEAAGVTVLTFIKSSIDPSYKTFIVNRPFIFLIRENTTKTILFMGKIIEPKY